MDWPLYHGNVYKTAGIVAASSDGTTVTSGASNNTKGSWQTIDASIPAGVTRFWLLSHYTSSTRNLIDIGVGSTPNLVVSNLYAAKRVDQAGWLYPIPCLLPPGEALKVRFQSQSSSQTATFSVIYELGGPLAAPPLGAGVPYGAEVADTSGITVDPGGTAHTKGSYVTFESATATPIRSLLLCFGGSAEMAVPPSRGTGRWLFDVAIGATSSEKIIIADLGVSVNSTGDSLNRDVYGPFDILIPVNTRISVRCQSNLTATNDRYLDLVIIGFR